MALAACSSSASESTAASTTAAASEPETGSAAETIAPATSVTASTGAPSTTADLTEASTVDPTVDRPYEVFVPSSYDEADAAPLVLLLHGYTSTGDVQEGYFGFQVLAEERGFLYVHPDGTKDAAGNQFWNATDACCDLASAGVDDSAYLLSIIEQVQADYNVDPKRIYLAGHSNGGFMSYRMACDHADKVAAIVSVAGATFNDPAACDPSEPVSVLQVHGTDDATIGYEGGVIRLRNASYPSADTTRATWAAYNGCGTTVDSADNILDLEARLDGPETSTASSAGCPSGIAADLWTINGGGHVPAISATFSADIVDFLYAHPKP
jgi:polyhydroxybutyrate depolymerase